MIFFCFFDYGDRYAGYFTVPVAPIKLLFVLLSKNKYHLQLQH